MKTKNNVQKTVLRFAAVVVSFVLLSFTVAAQGFWKQLLTRSSFNEIALALAENTAKTKIPVNTFSDASFGLNAEATSVEDEQSLELEPWMADNSFFYSEPAQQTKQAQDPVLSLENWMLEENNFNRASAFEKGLELESWMLNSRYFAN